MEGSDARKGLRGFTLIEVMIGLLLISVILSGVLSLQQHWIKQGLMAEQRQQLIHKAMLIDDILTSQLRHLGSFGCSLSKIGTLQIGRATSLPARLSRVALEPTSHWLFGNTAGQCAAYAEPSGAEYFAPLTCQSFSSGKPLIVDTCQEQREISVLRGSSRGVKFTPPAGMTMPLLVGNYQPTYWYVAPSKDTGYALWRKSARSGNGVEIINGVAKLHVYFITGDDDKVIADSILNAEASLPVEQVKGLWAEFLVQLSPCLEGATEAEAYRSFRGDTWVFNPNCAKVGQALIPL